ncbi:MAG TPA: M23 family peptidase, partial [Porphyromonadaceae bacterium]|nr:M23 family peptidase [Porphyromonadaceae bacterium]
KDKWAANKKITLKIGDNLSGVQDYKCKIDGKFVVFALDGKTGLLTYKIEPARVAPGKHELEVWLVDQCGNERTYKQNFAY